MCTDPYGVWQYSIIHENTRPIMLLKGCKEYLKGISTTLGGGGGRGECLQMLIFLELIGCCMNHALETTLHPSQTV